MKRFLIFALTVISFALCLTVVASAEDVIHTGEWGELDWELNETTGALTVSGDGEMNYFSSISTDAWRMYKDKIKTVIIEDGVTSIGSYAFQYCSNLTSITVPHSVTSIGVEAFQYCYDLTSITIRGNVTSIGKDAFKGCEKLTNVYIIDIAKWCNISFGNNYANPLYYADNLYLNGELVSDVVIPSGVVAIPDYAFDCNSLTSITIPEGVTSIGIYAFSCNSLTSITIPESVASIGSFAFSECTNLAKVYISDIAKWCNISFGNSYANPLYYADNFYLNGELVSDVVLPSGITAIPNCAFSCNSLTSIIIPDSVTSIGEDAFYGCTGLTNITIPDSVTSIGEGAFGYCTALESVTIGNNVTRIGSYAFYNCESITSIRIPDSVIRIGSYAFYNCTGLTDVTMGNNIVDIDDSAFFNCIGLTSIVIPESVDSIDYNAFSNCNSLKIVYIFSDYVIDVLTSNNECGYITYYATTVVVPLNAEVSSYIKGSFSAVVDITSGANNYTAYSKHDHSWTNNGADNDYMCSECGLETEHNNHSFKKYVLNHDATCTLDGTKTAKCEVCNETDTVEDTGSALGHNYDNACDRACNVCEEERTPSAHTWNEGAVTKEPTKKEQGEKTYTCTECHETKTEPIPMLTGCGGGSGAPAAFISCGGITAFWFALKRRIFHH